MKHVFITLAFMFMVFATGFAKCPNTFDPEKYNRELECTLIQEAKLTSQESQTLFPVLREFQQKMRELYKKQRQLHRACPKDENEALKVLKEMENTELAMVKLQQTYNARFLKIIPASKVVACMRAYENFNRDMVKQVANRKNNPQNTGCKKN